MDPTAAATAKEEERDEKVPAADAATTATATTTATGGGATRRIPGRVLEIHKVSQFHVTVTRTYDVPASMLNRKMYDPRIDLSAETAVVMVSFIGAGGNGDVWFAVTEDWKRCCAVKFFNNTKSASVEMARAEAANWDAVYGGGKTDLPACHVGYVAEGRVAYLCMPYIDPVPKRLWYMLDPTSPVSRFFGGGGGGELRQVLTRFADAGYKQGSIRWEHLGFFPKSKPEAAAADDDVGEKKLDMYMFDLGRIEKFSEGDDKEEWIRQSIRRFKDVLPPFEPPESGDDIFREMSLEGHFFHHTTFSS